MRDGPDAAAAVGPSRGRFAFLPSHEAADARALLLPNADDDGLQWHLLPAGVPSAPDDGGAAALRGWKGLCDVLLPALRPCSHLYNLIYRHRVNCSLVLTQRGVAVAGATYRLLHDRTRGGEDDGGGAGDAILEVLLLAVEQRAGVCGRGYGTRLVNNLKALLLRRAAALGGARAVLLTQADIGEQALAFWSRQQLREEDAARALLLDLRAWHRSNIVYDYTVPMVVELPRDGWRCDERPSSRAQQLDEMEGHEASAADAEVSDGADAEAVDGGRGDRDGGRQGAVARQCWTCRRSGVAQVLRCEMCSRLTCSECAARVQRSGSAEGDAREDGGDDEPTGGRVLESLHCAACNEALMSVEFSPASSDAATAGLDAATDAPGGGGGASSAPLEADGASSVVAEGRGEAGGGGDVAGPASDRRDLSAFMSGRWPSRHDLIRERQRAHVPPPRGDVATDADTSSDAVGVFGAGAELPRGTTDAVLLWRHFLHALARAYPEPRLAADQLDAEARAAASKPGLPRTDLPRPWAEGAAAGRERAVETQAWEMLERASQKQPAHAAQVPASSMQAAVQRRLQDRRARPHSLRADTAADRGARTTRVHTWELAGLDDLAASWAPSADAESAAAAPMAATWF